VPATASAAPSVPPCETIWVCNLPDKVKKGPLKDALYRLYSTFGSIKGINVTKTKALRGQAWISFSDVAQSATALRDTQGQLLFGKPIVSCATKDLPADCVDLLSYLNVVSIFRFNIAARGVRKVEG
jgi:RNA recognition motif. (a.k.a. RRM, RBD, or RNP domain)